MKKYTFYSGFDLKTNDVIDERMYVDGLTKKSLTERFGDNGEYSRKNIFVFNTKNDNFYKLENENKPLKPSSWLRLSNSFVSFPKYKSSKEYDVGDCAMFTDSYSETTFNIANSKVSSGETPESTPSKWTNLSETNKNGNGEEPFRKTYKDRIDVNSGSNEFDVYIDKKNLPDETSPFVDCFVDLGDKEEGGVLWCKCYPIVQTWDNGTLIKTKITFNGNLSSINYDSSDAQQKNLKVIFN